MAAAHDDDPSAKSVKKDTLPIVPPPKPTLTRAERRAKQEKDREVKAAAKAGATSNNKSTGTAMANKPSTSSKVTSTAGSSQQPSKPTKTVEASKPAPVKETAPAAALQSTPETRDETRGLRIFSHFGLSKQPGSSNLKGPLHPAIFRLALQFSDFQIVGANARCIATLKAFQAVSVTSASPRLISAYFFFPWDFRLYEIM